MATKALGNYGYATFGADPEFFFSDAAGQIVGSEKVLPEGGKLARPGSYGVVTCDGVQAELTTTSGYSCRQSMGHTIRGMFRELEPIMGAKGVKADFRPVVEVSREHLDTLSKESRILGCSPSFNIYDRPSELLESINPEEYRKRSAGGHLHFSGEAGFRDPKRAVPLFDLLIGLPCVMLDRDPSMAERRQLYGRAGEYRTPSATKNKGADIEYRTLSNFWLRSFKLMHFVTGLGRLCASVLNEKREGELLSLVDRDAVIEAINTNDFDAARKLWFALKPTLAEMEPYGSESFNVPIWASMLPKFDALCDKGIEHYWPASTAVARWTQQVASNGEYWGFEKWIAKQPAPPLVIAVAAPTTVADIKPPTVTQEGAPDRWTNTDRLRPTGDAARGDLVAEQLNVKKSRRLPARDARGRFQPRPAVQPSL